MNMTQWRVLSALVRVTADGWPAAIREVTKAAGFASSGNVHRVLLELDALGLAETNPRQPTRRGGWKPTNAGVSLIVLDVAAAG